MNIERDKFLTEAMGECWHERIGTSPCISDYYKCKCGKSLCFGPSNYNNFSSWEGFGKLWEWVYAQEWKPKFIFHNMPWTNSGLVEFINPDKFADAVYQYLKETNK